MIRQRWLAAMASCATLLGGCGSSPPVHYYDLEALETGYAATGEPSLRIGVGPLRTPDYLDRSQIVTRGADSRVIVDDFNRWVEPIGEALYRVLSANLDSLLDEAVVVAFPYTHIADLDYQVVGRVSRFDAGADGTAVLEVQWGIISQRDDFVVQPKRARYEAGAGRAGDYPALARAMSELLQQFSRDVAQTLEGVVQRAGS